MDGENPCEDGNPCTTDTCVNNGGIAECGSSLPKDDYEPCDNGDCFGDDAYCLGGDCIPGPSRPCNDTNICTVDECMNFPDSYDCKSLGPDLLLIECGTTVSISDEVFETREYYEYGDSCTGLFPGAEGAISLVLASDANVTLQASNALPSMNINFMFLENWCDPSSCVLTGTNTINMTMPAGEHVFVLEAEDGEPPTNLDLTVTCSQ